MTDTTRLNGQVAPLGRISSDGRILDPDGAFPHRELPLPVTWRRLGVATPYVNAVAGEVTDVTVTPEGITATVTLDDEDAVEQVRSGQRVPAVELTNVESDVVDGVLVIRSGTVVGVALTEVAAWPSDLVWLTEDPS